MFLLLATTGFNYIVHQNAADPGQELAGSLREESLIDPCVFGDWYVAVERYRYAYLIIYLLFIVLIIC